MSFRLTVFGRGFNSRRLHHLTIQGSPMKCKSPFKIGAFLIYASVVVFTDFFTFGVTLG
jgi:hypothetical protein